MLVNYWRYEYDLIDFLIRIIRIIMIIRIIRIIMIDISTAYNALLTVSHAHAVSHAQFDYII